MHLQNQGLQDEAYRQLVQQLKRFGCAGLGNALWLVCSSIGSHEELKLLRQGISIELMEAAKLQQDSQQLHNHVHLRLVQPLA